MWHKYGDDTLLCSSVRTASISRAKSPASSSASATAAPISSPSARRSWSSSAGPRATSCGRRPSCPGSSRKYPDAFITWVVDEESVDLLRDNPLIDRVLPFNLETAAGPPPALRRLYSLDKDPAWPPWPARSQAPRKFGFGLNEHGNLVRLQPGRRLCPAPRRGRRAQVQDQSKILPG